jgi:hypothetical protein
VRVEISSNHYITLVSFVVLAHAARIVPLLLHMLMLPGVSAEEHVGRVLAQRFYLDMNSISCIDFVLMVISASACKTYSPRETSRPHNTMTVL